MQLLLYSQFHFQIALKNERQNRKVSRYMVQSNSVCCFANLPNYACIHVLACVWNYGIYTGSIANMVNHFECLPVVPSCHSSWPLFEVSNGFYYIKLFFLDSTLTTYLPFAYLFREAKEIWDPKYKSGNSEPEEIPIGVNPSSS